MISRSLTGSTESSTWIMSGSSNAPWKGERNFEKLMQTMKPTVLWWANIRIFQISNPRHQKDGRLTLMNIWNWTISSKYKNTKPHISLDVVNKYVHLKLLKTSGSPTALS